MSKIKIESWNDAGIYINDLKIDLNYFDFGLPGNPNYSWMAKTFTNGKVVKAISETDENPLVAIEKLLNRLNLTKS